jgi:hypothetical protein
MDGIMHNLARKQRRQLLDENDSSYESHSDAKKKDTQYPLQEIVLPLKGILKPTRVRFEGFPDDGDIHIPPPPSPLGAGPNGFNTFSQTSHFLPQPPPPDEGPRTPSLFTKDIEADQFLSRSAYITYTKFIDELSEFVDQQGQVVRKRLAVQSKRTELKRQREIVSRSDVMLIDKVRNYMSSEAPSGNDEMVLLFEAAQEARDRVGPMEAEYEPMEIDLGAEESKLQAKYADLEMRFEHFFRLKVTSTRQSEPSDIEYEASTTASMAEEFEMYEENANHEVLLHGTRIGEQVQIGQSPVMVKESVHADQTLIEVKKQPASSDLLDFLPKHRSSVTTEDKAQEVDLTGISGTETVEPTWPSVPQFSQEYMSLSFMKLGVGTIFEPFEDLSTSSDDLLMDPRHEDADDILLLEDDVDDAQSRSVLSDYLIRFDSTRDRVNRWMLHQLRISPREAHTLKRQVACDLSDILDWTVVSLREWSNDEMGCLQPYYQGSIEDEEDDLDRDLPQNIPNPCTEPILADVVKRHRPKSSLISNAAFAPTISDLHNRSSSTTQVVDPSIELFKEHLNT